jgi:hypothetical protein
MVQWDPSGITYTIQKVIYQRIDPDGYQRGLCGVAHCLDFVLTEDFEQ